jgi:hypothetical protein
MIDDIMDTDIAMQVLNAHSVNLGGNDDDGKNSDRKSFISKIWTKFEFGRDDVMDPKTIRYRFMALADVIVKATKGDSDSIYLATIDGKRIDPQSSPTDPAEFQTYVNWATSEGRQSSASTTLMLHSSVRFVELRNRILPFLQQNKIYIKPNYTASSLEEIVRVAVIPFMNQDSTFRKGFSMELNQTLQQVVNLKDAEFKERYPCINDVFKFDVIVSKSYERMTFQKQKVATFILLVECPKSQSLLCRKILQEALTLLSPTDDSSSQYTCVPLVLKNQKKYPKGPAAVFHLLRGHCRFLEEFRSFQIRGVHRTTMATLKTTFMKECSAIKAIEPTFQSDEFGKWTICSNKEKIKDAQDWIDTNLQLIMDNIPPEDKPPIPKAVIPQRIVSYAEVSDLHIDNLVALSGLSIAPPPTTNPWNNPPSNATTQPSTNFSPLSESQTTLISTLVAEVHSLKSTVASQNKTIDNHKTNITTQLSAQSIKIQTIQTSLDDNITFMARENNKRSVQINEIKSQVKTQETTIESINDRINNISKQVSPLNEAVQAGGLAALIQQTVLGCLRQTQTPNESQIQLQPMEEDFSHTPRQLFDPALSTECTDVSLSSGKKRDIPPSPFSRKGQSSPVRARLDLKVSDSSSSLDDL